MWSTHGIAAMSARQIAANAQTTTSLINYYYGGFEQLLLSAQASAATEARAWCQAQLDAIADLTDLGADAAGHLTAVLIDTLCDEKRHLVFAWAECHLLAARNPAFVPAARQWLSVWQTLWAELARRFGIAGRADAARLFFCGELSMHRIRWNAPFDRATLSETCVAWMRLLHTGRAGDMTLHDFARGKVSGMVMPALLEGTIERVIADAAADLVGAEGPGAVTHRAVARTAGVNLGSVTHHFPTADALMRAAFERIYDRVTQDRPAAARPAGAVVGGTFVDGFARFMAARDRAGMLAIDELVGEVGRNATLATFGGVLRYTRGKSSIETLSRMQSSYGALGRGEALLFSTWAGGVSREVACYAPEEALTVVEAAARQVLDILGVAC